MMHSGNIKSWNNKVAAWGLLVVFLTTAGAVDRTMSPTGVAEGYLANSDQPTSSAASLAHAAGEFRIVAANLLWIKVVDHYHHEYLARGGQWSHNTSLMPYLRMITCLDPHFVEAYSVGGTILSSTHRYNDAADYFQEGIRNNPSEWQLCYDMAMLRAWYQKDPKRALPFARQAAQMASDPFDRQRLRRFCTTLEQEIKTPSPAPKAAAKSKR